MTLKNRRFFTILTLVYIWSLFVSISIQTVILIIFLIFLLTNLSELQVILREPLSKAFLILTVVAIITGIFSPFFSYSAKNAIFAIIFDSLLPFSFGLLAARHTKEKAKKHSQISFLVFTSLALILYVISPDGFSPLINRRGFLTGFLGGKLTYAGVISSFSAILVEGILKGNYISLISFILFIITLALNTSRSYIFGALFAGGLLSMVKFKKFAKLACIIVIIVTASFFLVSRTHRRFETTSLKNPDMSIKIRLNLWKTGAKIVKTSPFTGIGFETWHIMADSLIREYGTSLLQNTIKTDGTHSRAIKGHVHNTYLQMLLNGGFILFVFYLYLIFTMLKEGFFIEKEEDKLAYFFMITIFLFAGFFEYNFSDAEVTHSVFFFTGLYLWRERHK